MTGIRIALAALALAGCASGAPSAERAPAQRGGEAERLLERMELLHPDLHHAVDEEALGAEARSLDERADRLGRDAYLVELMRLTARLGERDGHSGVFPLDPAHRRPPRLYGLRLYEFSDGLFVVGSVGEPAAVGSRLVAVNGVPVERAAAAVRPLVPRDNEWSLRARLPQYLVVAEVLHGLGLARSARSATFTLAAPDGLTRRVTLRPVAAARWAAAFPDLFHPMVPMGLPRRPKPEYLARRDERSWVRPIDGGRAVHVAYNVTLGSTVELAEELRRRARDPRVRKVILDLRHNPGGDNSTYRPLLEALRTPSISRRLVVLIGRTTFSAAGHLLVELERTTGAVFVGEPSGASPNLYADSAPILLPASGWNVNVATVYWEKSAAGDRRLAVQPDVRVELSSGDFFAGRDPVLEAALAL